MSLLRLAGRATTLLVTISAVALLAGCGDSEDDQRSSGAASASAAAPADLPVVNSGRLTFGTEAAFPPYEFIGDDKRTIEGLDADIARAISRELGLEAEFVNIGFSGLIPGLRGKKLDLIISAMVDSKERQKVIDFVDYVTVRMAALVKRGNPAGITSFDSMCGHTIAVQSGTVQVQYVAAQEKTCKEQGNPFKTLNFAKDSQAQLAVRDGRADANIQEFASMSYIAQKAGDGEIFDAVALTDWKPYPYGIGVRKNEPEMLAAVRDSFQRLIDSGEYDKLLEKWGVEELKVSKAAVNTGTT